MGTINITTTTATINIYDDTNKTINFNTEPLDKNILNNYICI